MLCILNRNEMVNVDFFKALCVFEDVSISALV